MGGDIDNAERGGSRAAGADGDSAFRGDARRRMLVRLAAAGAPMIVSLPAAAQTAAFASATRAAANDALLTPPNLPESSGDTWIRQEVPFGNIVACQPDPEATTQSVGTSSTRTSSKERKPRRSRKLDQTSGTTLLEPLALACGTGETLQPVPGKTDVYAMPSGKYFSADGSEVAIDPTSEQFQEEEKRFVLVLFQSAQLMPGSYTGQVFYWPETAAVGGLQGLHCSSWTSATGQTSPPPGTTCIAGG